jgi:NDP-4-keto-2,6-dideoxyhexose 3-C-methyltransferase
MYTQVTKCRICGNPHLEQVLDLGDQTLTGVFPKMVEQKITRGPLQLVKCFGSNDCCGLLQLAHSYDLGEMYGENYGYRSGLNQSMVQHLHTKVARIMGFVGASGAPLVLDIGSNDGTTLSAYPSSFHRVGMDPTASKFRQYYPEGVDVIADFFSAERFRQQFPGKKAKVVTSFSMFYDLESPMGFMNEVISILDDQGIWVFEQSYMPMMLDTNSYDTACHEHLEYYALKQIKWMTDRVGLKIVDVEFNNVNGGSFSVTVAKDSSEYPVYKDLAKLLSKEAELGLDTLVPFRAFEERTKASMIEIKEFVANAINSGKRVGCLGASTKGNVLLQYCGFTSKEICMVAEVNPEKYGCFTPGTLLPIVPESEMLMNEPDYLIVLPWHFRAFFLNKYEFKKAKLVFPLPQFEIV